MISCYINFGLFFIALGGYGIFEGIRLANSTKLQYGPGQYVAIISALILIVGIVYFIQKIKEAGKGKSGSKAVNSTAIAETENGAPELPKGVASCFSLKFRIGKREMRIGPAILAFVLFVLYAVLTNLIGYLLSTLLFVVSATLLFGERVWWKLALSGVVSAVTFWAVFVKFASIPL